MNPNELQFNTNKEGLKALGRMVTPEYKPATGNEYGKPGVTVGFDNDIYGRNEKGDLFVNHVRKVPKGKNK